ncbi:dehydrogenase [Streptomyces avermitilis]|uniref:3-isopropylmalate dehydrogenase n=2 Tax=Streptomyces avermitilis TaxID=33903 RepID=A0A4D4NAL9_STRAX|nr:isocitrate/isopropylmalate dehydrogenase family protein [Streptomyces avermitilis]KUN47767.1 dehydrogenase [Streptomyces avermitilis]BAU77524.1 putative isocitrate/isopropylmalate dehydrogenase [Streptomyces avermitilis MA-4680 = NBRC 14893]BBJ56258.1 3-isopropylmalate dehydrogenase [Streptomyces avermitilis]GDY70192.1 3-isopropylmalate dehydrogenase [Streptomyces avermitilis]GDY80495.1 3-isopropylmalate dehydrogenase [Streptomyces avermitilis]
MTTITVIPGDGIGPEVTHQGTETLEALGLALDIDVLDHVNAETYLQTRTALSDDDFARVRASASTLLGAVGDARVDSDYARQVLLRLRIELDLFVNYRPARLFHDRLSPLRQPEHRPIDCVIVRENTEGLYSQAGGVLRSGTEHETALDVDINTFHGVSRILDFAFSIATRSVCMVDKSNAVRHGGQLWQRCFQEISSRHPELEITHEYVDAAAMKLVADPTRFDVIVANNSYGDILSDLAAELAGGLGTSASANINGATGFGLFEPVHGTAPDIAGQGIANPIGSILSAALLIERLGYTAEAQAVRNAVNVAIEAGQVTPDLGGQLSTKDAGAAIRAHL